MDGLPGLDGEPGEPGFGYGDKGQPGFNGFPGTKGDRGELGVNVSRDNHNILTIFNEADIVITIIVLGHWGEHRIMLKDFVCFKLKN